MLEGYEEAARNADPSLVGRLAAIRSELDADYVLESLDETFAGCEEGVSRTTAMSSPISDSIEPIPSPLEIDRYFDHQIR